MPASCMSPPSPHTPPPPGTVPPRPSQIRFIRPAQMALFAKIISYPPLAQVTVLPSTRKEIKFTVLIESSQSFPEQPWETSIWYDHAGYSGSRSQWLAIDLEKTDAGPTVLSSDHESNVYRHFFTGTLPSPFQEVSKTYKGRNVKFTIRYRTNSHEPWQWVNTQFGTRDGELILQPPIDPNWLGASPVELEHGWNLRKLTSEAPDARLYYIESAGPMSIPDPEDAGYQSKDLGRVTYCSRFFALVRIWSPWLAPRHGGSLFNITEDAIVCSFLRVDGRHVVLLAINGIDDVLTVFRSKPNGDIVVAARNDSGKDGKFRLLAASAWDFEIALAAVIYEMRKMVRLGSTSRAPSRRPSQPREPMRRNSQHVIAESVDSDPDTVLVSKTEDHSGIEGSATDDSAPTPQWLESWYDNMAYCTWNSLGQNLTAEKVMEGLESLAQNNIKIATLIIDDNWQSLDAKGEKQFYRGMTEFEANHDFPGGLKALTTQIREKYPWIRDIAVWHALMGYWGGVSPHGSIAHNYRTRWVEKTPNDVAQGKMLVIHQEDVHRFYDDFYKFLSDSGITSVKTDAQFMLDMLDDTPDRRDLITPYQSAWTQAHLSHFAGKAISCMSQIPQVLFHSFLPTNTPRILLRNSDDFFPKVEASHTWHVFCNAHNALLVQHLNVLPDWDMFQTVHDFSGFHAASRCLSGGPIYITDSPGEHDVELIKQMTARGVRSGESVILRPSCVGKTIGIYDGFEEGSVLRIGVWDGKSDVGTGLLGVFNTAKEEKTFVLPITDFPGVEMPEEEEEEGEFHGTNGVKATATTKWVFRSHVTKRITRPITPSMPLTPDQLLQGTLAVRGYDIWSALPVHDFELASGRVEVAVLGLLWKMTGAVAIVESRFGIVEGGKRLKIGVQMKALGVLGVWVSELGRSGRKVEDLMVLLKGMPVHKDKVEIEVDREGEAGSGVVKIDVEGAWDEMALDPGWSNEVWVDIFIP